MLILQNLLEGNLTCCRLHGGILKCDFLQLQPFENFVVVNIIIRQKCPVAGNKKAYSNIGR